jgi:hypothetical protein
MGKPFLVSTRAFIIIRKQRAGSRGQESGIRDRKSTLSREGAERAEKSGVIASEAKQSRK